MTATRQESSKRSGSIEYHHYGPHRVGLPPLVDYFRGLWQRRTFVAEMSRAAMRSAHTSTFFGQAWLILNPLLLASVYYLLVAIIRGQHQPALFSHVTLSLFAFTIVSTAVNSGSTSVVSAGMLLINTAFPRLLIPLATVRTAFFRFLPTVGISLLIHLVFGDPWHLRMLLSVFFLTTMVVFAMGLAAFFATVQVYFRDTSSFLPFAVRIWMYLSPVLWLPQSRRGMAPAARAVIELNPMYSMLGGYTDLIRGVYPPSSMWLTSAAWALAVVVIGCLFFISRERDFAVRLV